MNLASSRAWPLIPRATFRVTRSNSANGRASGGAGGAVFEFGPKGESTMIGAFLCHVSSCRATVWARQDDNIARRFRMFELALGPNSNNCAAHRHRPDRWRCKRVNTKTWLGINGHARTSPKFMPAPARGKSGTDRIEFRAHFVGRTQACVNPLENKSERHNNAINRFSIEISGCLSITFIRAHREPSLANCMFQVSAELV